MFRKILDQGQAGDNVGCLLRGIKREEIERGQVLCKPGSITPHTKFKAEVYVLKKEEGGRHTPFFNGYRPQFYFRTTDVTGVANLPEGTEMVMPGDNVQMDSRADPAHRHGRRPALRHPRGRPHRRLRRRHRDHQVAPAAGTQARRGAKSTDTTIEGGPRSPGPALSARKHPQHISTQDRTERGHSPEQDPHPPQGLRLVGHRDGGQGDRRDRHADRRDRLRPGAAADGEERATR